MFRWMPATRRVRLRWFSPSLDALSQTSRAVSAASIDVSASRPRAAAATTPRRRQSATRAAASAASLFVSPTNRLDVSELGLLRFELGPARSELVARLHKLLDAARPFVHPCWRTWSGADMFPKFSPTMLGSCEQPCRARFRGLREGVSARLFVEPLGFQSWLGQARGVLNRLVSQTIRLPIQALEFGDVSDERGLRRSLRRPEYRRAQRPPRRVATRPRLHNAFGRGQRAASRKPGKPRGRFFDLLFRWLPRPWGVKRRSRGRLECVRELNKILRPRHREPRQRFE